MQPTKRLLSTCAAGALVVGSGLLAAQPAQAAEPSSYSVMLLQYGGASGSASGLNNNGDVVGSSWGPAGQSGTIWYARSGIGGDIYGLGYDGSAHDISGDRTIVGSVVMAGDLHLKSDGTGGQYDFGYSSFVRHISENGVAAVTGTDDEEEGPKAYIATSSTELTELLPPADTTAASVRGISEDGKRAAGSASAGDTRVPVLWTDGVGKRLTSPAGASEAYVMAVNTSGEAVGCGTVDGVERPYLYDASGKPTVLPLLPGHTAGCATGLNNAGMVIGRSLNGDKSTPTIWIDGQPHSLNDLVPNRAGYTLGAPNDINASGQVVGTATLRDGTARGYIATPSTAETIYTAPGTHHFNGRDWNTTCEPYSQTTRCRTEIIATQVQYNNGSYSRVTGWAFNNLTYNPSPRTQWSNNPLGKTGEWTADDGRKWRTECDTTNTGRNGCRSYVQARVADAVAKTGGGYTYTVETKWVFNNIVKFN